MGYRSDIAFAIQTEKPIEGLYAILKIAEYDGELNGQPFISKQDVSDTLKDIVKHMRIYRSKNLLTFYANQWKWYGDCQVAYEHIMHLASNYDNDVCGRFARIGESSDDVEEDAYGDSGWDLDYPYIVRELAMDSTFNEEGDEDAKDA